MYTPDEFNELEFETKRKKLTAILGLYSSQKANALSEKIQDARFDDALLLSSFYRKLYVSASQARQDNSNKLKKYASKQKLDEQQSMNIEEKELEKLLELL